MTSKHAIIKEIYIEMLTIMVKAAGAAQSSMVYAIIVNAVLQIFL
jgi:hypothetical protein